MNAPIHTFIMLTSLLLMSAGCGSTSKREFQAALNHEETVAHALGSTLAQRGHAHGTILVLTLPEAGPRLREAELRRIQGLRQALSSVTSSLDSDLLQNYTLEMN